MNTLDLERMKDLIAAHDARVSLYYANLMDPGGDVHMLDAERVLPAASLIKVLVLIEALRQIERRSLKLGQRVKIQDFNRVDGSRINEFTDKADFSLLELLRWIILVSDDTATNQVIDLVGMDQVNALAITLGLDDTRLLHKMADARALERGTVNVTTAADMGRLLGHVYRDSIPHAEHSRLSAFICRQTIALMRECRDDNALLRHLPWTMSCAHKTGHLPPTGAFDAVTHDMGIITATGGSYILVVMVEGAADPEQGQRLIGAIGREVYHQVLYTP